ncbi:MAG: hypothetical protein GOU97_01220 [Nanoarchaeota archaeon]|nr:hypothetical protein [Nanoarchaeota archaeon]
MVSLHVRVHYSDRENLKRSVQVLAFVCAGLLALTWILPSFGLNTASYLSGIGLLGYSMILFYEFSKFSKNNYVKTFFKSIIAILLFLLLMTLLTFGLIEKNFSGQEIFGIALTLTLILFPVLAWDWLHSGIKKVKTKKGMILLILPFLLIQQVMGVDLTSLNNVESITNLVKSFSGVAGDTGFFGLQKQFLTSMLDLSDTSGIILAVIFLVIIYLVMKFIATIIKWVIIITVLWVALTLLGAGMPVDINHLLKLN